MSDTTVRVNEIYETIQGEGTLSGMPCTLIRLAGCPLRCGYCDTIEALPFSAGDVLRIDQIIATVQQQHHPLVLLTGGEPLAQKASLRLLRQLSKLPSTIQLETSGAFDISRVDPSVRRIVDIKTPGSGESGRVMWENMAQLKAGDEVKFVLTSRSDFDWALTVIETHALMHRDVPIFFSAAWGMIEPAVLAEWILKARMPVRLLLQQHKYIWGADASGV